MGTEDDPIPIDTSSKFDSNLSNITPFIFEILDHVPMEESTNKRFDPISSFLKSERRKISFNDIIIKHIVKEIYLFDLLFLCIRNIRRFII